MVYSDKLFVLTPEGDLRVLLDEGDPQKVDALEQAIFRNQVTEDVLFATGQGIAPWMASVTFGGKRPANGLYRISQRQTDTLLPLACRGTADGALGRELIVYRLRESLRARYSAADSRAGAALSECCNSTNARCGPR